MADKKAKSREVEFEEVFGGLGETIIAGKEEKAGELSIAVTAED